LVKPNIEVSGKDTGDTTEGIRSDANVSDFEKMTLSELCDIFGTDEKFKIWLNGRKTIVDIKAKELKLEQDKGNLVSRELIKTGVIEPFDTTFTKMLSDGARSIAVRVCAMNGAGRSVDDCEKFIADQLSSFIRPAKAKIKRALENA
ncbi:MAG: hypothetical protein KAT65_17370, partial [Methanophagales archaeon]|nr:hypothetical protein [Methanophagales archaeon]